MHSAGVVAEVWDARMVILATFILGSRPSFPWFWPLLGACAGGYLFYRGFQLLQRKRLIMNTPASKIRSAAMGLVELSGLASGPYTITAPITGLPCYYYRTLAWQWKQEAKSSSWEKVADECLHLPFFLDDNTGRVLVNPQGAELDIHRDFHDEFSTSVFSSGLEIPANISNFLLTHGVSTDKKIKVDEYCIKPKNALFILGTLAHNPGIEVSAVPVRSVSSEPLNFSMKMPGGLVSTLMGGLGSFGGSVVASSFSVSGNTPASEDFPSHAPPLSPAQQEKVAAALGKAGITNPAAWMAAGIDRGTPMVAAAGNGSAAATAPALEQFDLHPPTVLMKGAHNSAFLISWKSQRDVLKSLGWKSTLMIWGGPALALVCGYILAADFGWL